jgi:hypothetical protein
MPGRRSAPSAREGWQVGPSLDKIDLNAGADLKRL